MANRVWFTADTHFGHTKALDFRPMFSSVPDMNETMIERWNNCGMKKGDRIYHLGDFGFCQGSTLEEIRKRLFGDVYLILGNHDQFNLRQKALFSWVKDYHYFKVNNQKIALFHYAMRTWRGSHHGSWSLYGHSHGKLPGLGLSLDVGVDCWNFTPISFEQISEKLLPK